MGKFIFLAILISMLSGCSTAAYKEYKTANPEADLGEYGEFKIVNTVIIPTSNSINYAEIVQDPNTGCMYIADSADGKPLNISPLYDNEGQVKGCGTEAKKEA